MTRRRRLIGGGLTIRSGNVLWVDAADTGTISTGSTFTWRDKSGAGNNLSQATAAAQPTTGATTQNGYNVLDFAGNDYFDAPSALFTLANGDNTVFFVSKRNTETGSSNAMFQFADTPTNAFQLFYSSTAGSITYKNRLTAGGDLTSTGNTNTNFNVIMAMHSGTTGQTLQINNGTPATNASGENVAGIDDGAFAARFDGTANWLIGSIAEIIIYNRALSTAESGQVNKYLLNKWI